MLLNITEFWRHLKSADEIGGIFVAHRLSCGSQVTREEFQPMKSAAYYYVARAAGYVIYAAVSHRWRGGL